MIDHGKNLILRFFHYLEAFVNNFFFTIATWSLRRVEREYCLTQSLETAAASNPLRSGGLGDHGEGMKNWDLLKNEIGRASFSPRIPKNEKRGRLNRSKNPVPG